jgi:hypothetical protein
MLVTGNIAPSLVKFVYQTFGERFGGLLLAGYGQTALADKQSFIFTEIYGNMKIDWMIDVVSDDPPCGEEPLVFAALLKLMLSRTPIAEPFYFKMADLMRELGWSDTLMRERIIDHIIEKYIALTFRKYEHRRRRRYRKEGVQWGRYKLVSGYLVESVKRPSDAKPTLTYSRIDFDTKFVRGLNDGRITFADLEFGALNPPITPNPDDQPQ